jgi:hypothetical protein
MSKKLNLDQIGLKYKSDKSSRYHCYLELYDKYFSENRNKSINLLEIGILFGDSLIIFNEYFENAKITAIDIEDKSHLKKENIDIIQGEQSNKELLNKFKDDYFDIILDDGSHKMYHQQISFGVLFRKLKSKGIYVIEDLHTSLDEYRENIEKDGALTRRFQPIILNEPTIDETINILNNIKKSFEDYHKVLYTEEAIIECVKLSDRYITDRAMPDKAIDILDEADDFYGIY